MTRQGYPQRGVLSPLLWYLVVDNILQKLNDVECTVIGYADITILSSGKFGRMVSDMMQGVLSFVER